MDKNKLSDKYDEYISISNKIDSKLSQFSPLIGGSMTYNSVDDPLSGQIVMKEYGHNEEYMRRRTEDLMQVKEISAKVASLSTDIKMETFAQGEKLNEIEGNIITVKDNTIKAEKEARETEILTRSNKKKLFCLAGMLVGLLIILFFIFRSLIK